jgi:hypothetical protein
MAPMSAQDVPESTLINENQATPEPMGLRELPTTLVVDGNIVPLPNKAGRPERDPAEWVEPWLRYYAEWGNMYNASRFAGVDAKTARKHRRTHADFDRAVREARKAFKAGLQEELVKQSKGVSKGNTIATLARLKATGRKMAERYSEKAVDARVMNLTIHAGQAAPPDADAMLTRIFARMGADEQAAMLGKPYELPERTAAEIIDVTPEETP